MSLGSKATWSGCCVPPPLLHQHSSICRSWSWCCSLELNQRTSPERAGRERSHLSPNCDARCLCRFSRTCLLRSHRNVTVYSRFSVWTAHTTLSAIFLLSTSASVNVYVIGQEVQLLSVWTQTRERLLTWATDVTLHEECGGQNSNEFQMFFFDLQTVPELLVATQH